MAFDVGNITFLSIPRDALVQGGDPTKTVLVTVSGPFCWADLYITPEEALALVDRITPKLEQDGEQTAATLSFNLNLRLKGVQVKRLVDRIKSLDSVQTYLQISAGPGPFKKSGE